MRKFARNTLAAAAVMTVTLGLTATPAFAATWTVSPGGAISGSNDSVLFAEDVDTGANVVCDTSSASGSAQSGSGLSGDDIAQLTDVDFSDSRTAGGECIATNNILATITPDFTNGAWTFDAQTFDPGTGNPADTGVTSGRVEKVRASLHGSDECDAVIGGTGGTTTGTIDGEYDNATGQLSVSGANLEVLTADGDCDPDLINAGDTIRLEGSYVLDQPQVITQQP